MTGIYLSYCSYDALGGYIIAWRASSVALWSLALARVKAIPAHRRTYSEITRRWWIDTQYMPSLADVFVNYAEALSWRNSSRYSPEVDLPASVVRACHVLYITPDAPPEVAQAAYKALAKLAHPDHGGSHHEMVRLNQAYECLTTWRTQHSA